MRGKLSFKCVKLRNSEGKNKAGKDIVLITNSEEQVYVRDFPKKDINYAIEYGKRLSILMNIPFDYPVIDDELIEITLMHFKYDKYKIAESIIGKTFSLTLNDNSSVVLVFIKNKVLYEIASIASEDCVDVFRGYSLYDYKNKNIEVVSISEINKASMKVKVKVKV